MIVMTLSQQQNALTFDENGDLKETVDKCAGPNKRVLTDLQARSLAKTAINIRTIFGSKKEQDIENLAAYYGAQPATVSIRH